MKINIFEKGFIEILNFKEENLNLKEKVIYIGFEPSGRGHIGWLLILKKLKEFYDNKFKIILYIADIFAYINDKENKDIEKIKNNGHYLINIFKKYGFKGKNFKVVWASKFLNKLKVFPKIIEFASKTTFNMIKKTLTIMGRNENETISFDKYFYPLMQIYDISELGVNFVLAGMDQRKIHTLAIDLFNKLKINKNITYLHLPLIRSFSSKKRMGSEEDKMSKSKEEGIIYLEEEDELLKRKIMKSYMEFDNVLDSAIFDLLRYYFYDKEELFFDKLKINSNYNNIQKEINENKINILQIKEVFYLMLREELKIFK